MGVAQPVFGQLLSDGVHQVGEPATLAELIHPRVEPEIVLLIGERLVGPNVTRADVINAAESVMCGLEIIDPRYADFSFTAADVIADNTSGPRRGRNEFAVDLRVSPIKARSRSFAFSVWTLATTLAAPTCPSFKSTCSKVSARNRKRMLRAITAAVHESIDAPVASIRVWIHEFPATAFLSAGQRASERTPSK